MTFSLRWEWASRSVLTNGKHPNFNINHTEKVNTMQSAGNQKYNFFKPKILDLFFVVVVVFFFFNLLQEFDKRSKGLF